MSETTAVETATKSSTLTRVGLGVFVLGFIALAIPLGYLLYANINGNVTLATAGAINNLLTFGVILTVAATVLALAAVGLHMPGLLKAPRQGLITGVLSVVLLLGAAAFLFTTMLPRTQAVQRVNDKLAPFGMSLETNCQNAIGQAQKDLKNAQYDAQNMADLGDDATYTTLVKNDVAALQTDGTTLTNGLAALNKLTAPDSKYQALLDGCKKDVTSEIAVVSNKGIPLQQAMQSPDAQAALQGILASLTPAQAKSLAQTLTGFVALNPQIDAVTLLQDSAAAVGPTLPAGSVETFVALVLTGVNKANSDPTLTAEGNTFKADVKKILDDNLAPFVVTVPLG